MNDEIFSEMRSQLRPDDQLRADLFAAIAADDGSALRAPGSPASFASPPPAVEPGNDAVTPITQARSLRFQLATWFAGAAAVGIAVTVAVAPSLTRSSTIDLSDPPVIAATSPDETTEPTEVELPPLDQPPALAVPGADDTPKGGPARDYEQVYKAINEALQRGVNVNLNKTFEVGDVRAVPTAMPDTAAVRGSWQTNSQVAGIDEGDIVKSDGRTLFVVNGTQIALVSAAGGATRQLASIDTSAGSAGPADKAGEHLVQGPVVDLMIHGSTLVAFVTEYRPQLSQLPPSSVNPYVSFTAVQTKALRYDISDPSTPKFLNSLGQSGAYLTSRLAGDVLYLITEYLVADTSAIKAHDPKTFVPVVNDGAGERAVAAKDLVLLPNPDGPRYTVAGSIDLAAGNRIDTQSVLGGTQTTYLSSDSLVLAGTDYNAKPMSAKQSKAARLEDLKEVYPTRLTRISVNDGQFDLAGEGFVPGRLVNQFAIDEYQGNLRVAVTVDGTTAQRAWQTRPALYVLNSKLKIVGALPQLAQNETVQSVRFDGPVGYVVSYEQRDPLFALDLSKPTKPVVLSALKIPGFSSYLHPWAKGRLLGLGIDADDQGNTKGLKLSMFDTSNPADVKEITTKKVPFDDAEALSNHHAVLVDADHGLIGFAALSYSNNAAPTSRYLVYRYGPGGFGLAKKLPAKVDADGAGNGLRGLTIDGNLYVASAKGVDVYTTDSLAKLAGVSLS